MWKRDTSRNGVIMEGEYSREEFENVQYWDISEKIDGMNIRVTHTDDSLFYGSLILFNGRTENAIIPGPLLVHLKRVFTRKFFSTSFPGAKSITIFGEGYGPKIQKGGGLYRKNVSFVGFDIYVDGLWLKQIDVYDILSNACIPVVPCLGSGTILEIVKLVRRYPRSVIAEEKKPMEGVVARSYPLMLFRNGNPMMFKLKAKDFQDLEAEKNRK